MNMFTRMFKQVAGMLELVSCVAGHDGREVRGGVRRGRIHRGRAMKAAQSTRVVPNMLAKMGYIYENDLAGGLWCRQAAGTLGELL